MRAPRFAGKHGALLLTPMKPMRPVFLLLLLLSAACTRVPELETQVPKGLHEADFPKLIALGPDLLTPQSPGTEAEKLERDLNARRARLQARAARLRRAAADE